MERRSLNVNHVVPKRAEARGNWYYEKASVYGGTYPGIEERQISKQGCKTLRKAAGTVDRLGIAKG
jgi:hypothetical protein